MWKENLGRESLSGVLDRRGPVWIILGLLTEAVLREAVLTAEENHGGLSRYLIR